MWLRELTICTSPKPAIISNASNRFYENWNWMMMMMKQDKRRHEIAVKWGNQRSCLFVLARLSRPCQPSPSISSNHKQFSGLFSIVRRSFLLLDERTAAIFDSRDGIWIHKQLSTFSQWSESDENCRAEISCTNWNWKLKIQLFA